MSIVGANVYFMSNKENNHYYESDSNTDKGILGSFKVLFLIILIAVLIYLQLEYEILVFVWSYFTQFLVEISAGLTR